MRAHNWKNAYEHIQLRSAVSSVICSECGAVAIRDRKNGWGLEDPDTEKDCDKEKEMRPIRQVHAS